MKSTLKSLLLTGDGLRHTYAAASFSVGSDLVGALIETKRSSVPPRPDISGEDQGVIDHHINGLKEQEKAFLRRLFPSDGNPQGPLRKASSMHQRILFPAVLSQQWYKRAALSLMLSETFRGAFYDTQDLGRTVVERDYQTAPFGQLP